MSFAVSFRSLLTNEWPRYIEVWPYFSSFQPIRVGRIVSADGAVKPLSLLQDPGSATAQLKCYNLSLLRHITCTDPWLWRTQPDADYADLEGIREFIFVILLHVYSFRHTSGFLMIYVFKICRPGEGFFLVVTTKGGRVMDSTIVNPSEIHLKLKLR